MDRCLRDYGPETAPIRAQLKSYAAAVIARSGEGAVCGYGQLLRAGEGWVAELALPASPPGATHEGLAEVLLDKLYQPGDPERERLTLVNSKPLPFPPEPLRSGVIQATRASIARADRNGGRRDAWLRLLDRLGLGFDS